jgi:chromosomal replication initiation ATPase DnaA
LSAIKVTYRSPNCADSDSDADVVVEEEKEYDVAGDFVIVNSSHGAFSRLHMPSGAVPQYMVPVMSPSDVQGRGKAAPKTRKTAQMPSMTAAATTKLPNANTLTDALSKKLSSAHLVQQKQVKPLTVPERVQKLIREGTRVMVLMRGAPGSGKSHLAMQIIRLTMGRNCNPHKFIFSTDDFFVHTRQFIPSLLQEAHSWNHERVRSAAERKQSPIFVDNTNIEVSWLIFLGC